MLMNQYKMLSTTFAAIETELNPFIIISTNEFKEEQACF